MLAAKAFVTHLLNHGSVRIPPALRWPPWTALRRPPEAPRRPSTRRLHGDEVADDLAWMRRVDDPGARRLPGGGERLDRRAHRAPGRPAATGRGRARRGAARRGRLGSLARGAAGTTAPAGRPGSSTPSTYGARSSPAAPSGRRRCCSTRTSSPPATTSSSSASARSARTAGCSRTPSTTTAARSTGCASVTSPPARTSPTSWRAPTTAWAGRRTAAACSTRPSTRPTGRTRCTATCWARARTRDEVVWHEPDRRFELDVPPTRSGAYVRLVASSRDTTEVRLVDASRPGDAAGRGRAAPARARVPRRPPAGSRRRPPAGRGRRRGPGVPARHGTGRDARADHWREVVGHRDDTRVVAADAFGDHVVVTERHGGRRRLRVLDPAGTTLRLLEPAGAGESVALGRTDEADVPAFRVVREGWVRPPIHLDHDLVTGEETRGPRAGRPRRPPPRRLRLRGRDGHRRRRRRCAALAGHP